MRFELPTTKVTYKLPEILSTTEVQSIIETPDNIKHKALLMVIYGSGLRVSEAVKLRIRDIDSSRMTLHIRNCKNRKDRYAILSPIVYQYLRKYWECCKFKDYVFPGQKPEEPITTSTVRAIYKQAKKRAGIKKFGGVHALRHAFATHLLEDGVELFIIKRLLGHSSIKSTERYLNFSPCYNKEIRSPIDQMGF